MFKSNNYFQEAVLDFLYLSECKFVVWLLPSDE